MRTAQAFVTLHNGQRPRSTTAITAARDALTHLANTEPAHAIRFVGYQPNDQAQRIAVYETDYPDN